MSAPADRIEALAQEMYELMCLRLLDVRPDPRRVMPALRAAHPWERETEALREDWRAVARLAWDRVTDVVGHGDTR